MPTLTTTIVLQKTIEALVTQRPMLTRFSHEFTTERLKLNQQAIAHIKVKPTASDYDANNGGYKAGAQNLRDLLVDVPLTMDVHKHVTIKLAHLNALADNKGKLEQFFGDQAEVLGRGMTDYVFGKFTGLNFSHESIFSVANSDKDMLSEVRRKMNQQGARKLGRFGIVNSDVMEVLDNDARISNRNNSGDQQINGDTHGMLRNVAGFGEIIEDPDFPTNNGTALTSVTGTAATDLMGKTAHGLVTGRRVKVTFASGFTGLTTGTIYYAIRVDADTFKLATTLANAYAGTAINISADGTGATVTPTEAITGFFGSEEAVAIKTGLPTDGLEAARAFGIPTPVSDEVVTDKNSGLSMVGYKWFEPGTMDAYVTVAFVYGAAVGRQASTTTDNLLDKAGFLLRSE